ncbi:MAG: zf-HC2 domain-containing protein [Pedococcus sp.]
MIGSLRRMVTCHWTARHIERYLDADPAAPLTPEEVSRLESHLAICARCTQVAGEHRALHRALSLWPGRPIPDPATVERLRGFVDELVDDDQP